MAKANYAWYEFTAIFFFFFGGGGGVVVVYWNNAYGHISELCEVMVQILCKIILLKCVL